MLPSVGSAEQLTGMVNGQAASDLEERVAIALSKLQIPFQFRARINPLVGLTEERQNVVGEVEIDFLCDFLGRLYPINVDGEISHFFMASQRTKDEQKTAKINAALKVYNAHPLIRLPYTILQTQEEADRTIKYGFLNGFPQAYYEE